MRSLGALLLLVAGRALAQTPLPPVDTPPPSQNPDPGPPDPAPSPDTGGPQPQPVRQPPPPPPPTTSAVEGKLLMGPQLDIMPIGTLHVQALGLDASTDASPAFGIGGLMDYRVHPIFTVGFAPRFVVPVKADGTDESGSELDLRARVTAGKDITPKIRLHGVGSLGYSWVFNMISDAMGDNHTTSGLLIGIGAGIVGAITPRALLVGEMSYQWGFQRATVSGIRVEADTSYLTLGIGVVFPVM